MEKYQAPAVEVAFSSEELDREVLYAGQNGTIIFPPDNFN